MQKINAIPPLRARNADSHKGTYGHVLVVAGSRGMAGAAALAGLAALRSGAGLVRVASPHEVQPTVAGFDPSFMTWPLPQTSSGAVDGSAAWYELLPLTHDATVIAAGPGLGRSKGVHDLICELLRHTNKPLVLDADALNTFAPLKSCGNALKTHHSTIVATPHPGEAARLLGVTTAEIQRDRIGSAVAIRAHMPADSVVVLKGHETVVTDGTHLYVNTSGNPGMATGGCGDVLTGVVSAFLAQGYAPMDACVLATYVHGLAGDMARDDSGLTGMIASDIVDSLGDVFRNLDPMPGCDD
ncbi:NAD(P)H-hydrate dehydratase [bacterium]|nr:NAD(P)H-hydrate dehydratase [bacterium]